ncbi:MAG TPA: DsbA family protein [Gammaproteobacteria bacterium]|nr:DsbA family protein [Gammaproteobacteria bacterium]
MCSWCWGFSPVIRQIKNTFADRLKISLNLGGLRPGTTTPISEQLREEILHHWHEVQRLTGQPFRFENALPEGFVYDTEPASRAVLSMGKLQAENTLAYFATIQSAFYREGRDVTQTEVLTELTLPFGIDAEEFQTLFNANALRAQTWEHFKRSRQAGVRGFPTLIWQEGEQIDTLCTGYRPWPDIESLLEQRLSAGDRP